MMLSVSSRNAATRRTARLQHAIFAACVALVGLAGCNGCETVVLTGPVGDHLGGVTCGNGSVEDGEECDAGARNNTGAVGGCDVDCSWVRTCAEDEVWNDALAHCAPSSCGNGHVDADEECDNGTVQNVGAVGGCEADCTFVRSCPEGLQWSEAERRCLGDGAVCGNAVVEGAEECDRGSNNTGGIGGCTASCTFDHTCPVAQLWSDAFARCVADGPTTIFGTITEYTPRQDPIAAVTVNLRAGDGAVVASATTGQDGTFTFNVDPEVDYAVTWEVPARYYSEPGYQTLVTDLVPGEARRVDRSFLLTGVSMTVYDMSANGVTLPGTRVVVVDGGGNTIAGPYFTDADGWVNFPSTAQGGTTVFEHAGFSSVGLSSTSLDTTSACIIGGVGLTPSG